MSIKSQATSKAFDPRPFHEVMKAEMDEWREDVKSVSDKSRLSQARIREIIGGAPPTTHEWTRIGHSLPRLTYKTRRPGAPIERPGSAAPKSAAEAKAELEKLFSRSASQADDDLSPALAWHAEDAPVETEQELPMSFGQRIIKLRERERLSREALGDLVGVTGSAVEKWETDIARPTIDVANRLIELFPQLEPHKPKDLKPTAAPKPDPVVQAKTEPTPVPAQQQHDTEPMLRIGKQADVAREQRAALVKLGKQAAKLSADPVHAQVYGQFVACLEQASALGLALEEIIEVLKE